MDSPGDNKGDCRSGKNDPYSGAYGGDDKQADSDTEKTNAGLGS